MRIVYHSGFDSGYWPGPLDQKQAIIGEAWVGPIGFLDILETQLGLTGAYLSNAERALRLIKSMKSKEGFYSQSVEADAFGTAMKVMQWRDDLWLCGFRGHAKSQRLKQLSEVTQAVAPGIPDRLDAALGVLKKRKSIAIQQICLFEPEEHLSWSWKRILSGLRDRGVTIEFLDLQPVDASGDLAGCRKPVFIPQMDGSLQLLRVSGYSQAAEEAAVWLDSLPQNSSKVVIWPDPVLDHALHRHGLPTLGAVHSNSRNNMLSILPLIVELGFDPPDPQVAFEFLMLPLSPVRRSLAFPLVRALQEWPAVASDTWNRVMHQALMMIPDAGERERTVRRMNSIFDSKVSRSARYPDIEIRRRVRIVEEWVQGYLANNQTFLAECNQVIRQCSILVSLLDACGMKDVSSTELHFLLEQATDSTKPMPAHPAQNGICSVSEPGAIAGGVDYVLFWDFCQSRFERHSGFSVSGAEWMEMRETGVELLDPSELALRQAVGWNRPFQMTKKALLCICPMRNMRGDEEFPHPAWDEISSRAKDDLSRRLEVRKVMTVGMVEKIRHEPRIAVRPTEEFIIPAKKIKLREKESPSSLEKLFQCPLGYVLGFTVGLSSSQIDPPPVATDPLMMGNLCHHLLEQVLAIVPSGQKLSPEQGQERLEKLFDDLTPRLAAGLYLPGNEDIRIKLRMRLGLVIRDLLSMIRQGGFQIEGVEKKIETKAFGLQLIGKIDLVLGKPQAVIDFKWSGAVKRREELQKGCALQLATYSYLVREKGQKNFPAVAYLLIFSRRLLTTTPDRFPGAEVIHGPDPESTWKSVERTFQDFRQKIDMGQVVARGNCESRSQGEDIDNDLLSISANCQYCEYGSLCGQWFKRN